ncbi:glutaredoxin [Atopobiaceae bacterium 24-176]
MTEKKARALELYYKPSCPFCQKVLAWMESHGVENVTLFDTATDSEAADRLVKVGGKRQVPCLFIDGEPLYESDDIIAHLAQIIERPEDDIAR